jgi:hypothetical protein
MNTQYRQYEVYYLPWAPFDWDYIGGNLRVGKVVFRPFSDDALRGIDERVVDYLRLYFSRFRDLYNNPVNTITLCHYDPKHRGLLEPMTDDQRADFAAAVDVLTFCCIWGELRETFEWGMATVAAAQLRNAGMPRASLQSRCAGRPADGHFGHARAVAH